MCFAKRYSNSIYPPSGSVVSGLSSRQNSGISPAEEIPALNRGETGHAYSAVNARGARGRDGVEYAHRLRGRFQGLEQDYGRLRHGMKFGVADCNVVKANLGEKVMRLRLRHDGELPQAILHWVVTGI
ncbi:hypothetical protein AVEN_72732-1 [Araneus ventricosus]|uniref:Uncharacterized protein n=1 Tax=Araneus ventricosus TaxID=182803 RepID=A0A4Y2DQE0_ARAVE|nr:hypothetical protein AVEN_72732-1 [Araneus ventricosus]